MYPIHLQQYVWIILYDKFFRVSKIYIFLFIYNIYILKGPQNKQIKVLSAPQKALCMTISNSQEIITTIEKELITKAVIPEFGNDPVSIIIIY